jgi:hypothetical protein
MNSMMIGGEGGIRTHGGLAPTTVFETAPIDRSGTSPHSVVEGRLAVPSGGFKVDSARQSGIPAGHASGPRVRRMVPRLCSGQP